MFPEIREIRVSTLQKQESFAVKTADLSYCRNNIEIKLAVPAKGAVTALQLSACLTEREDGLGYPDAFVPEASLRLSVEADAFDGFLAVYQHKAWWARPAFGTRPEEIPEKTQLLITQTDGNYTVFLAVCGREGRADLKGGEDGIILTFSAGRPNRKTLLSTALLCGTGSDPYSLLEECFSFAKELQGNDFLLLKEKRRPELFNHYGWCTWDSLGRDVSEKAIIDKLSELKEKGLPMPWVLIDDGWSETNPESLTLKGLDADRERFPGGLTETIHLLKEDWKVPFVGVWQAMKGYWYGVEEGSEAAKALAPFMMRYGDGTLTAGFTPDKAFGFWNAWHGKLARQGVDFVKIDGQGSVPLMINGSVPEDGALRQLYEGMEASVFLHFGGALINCMGMAPENVWNRGCSAVSRSSDDYMPKAEGSIAEHLLQNCYDSLYQGPLYVCDWDMFWSEHPEAFYSAVMRIISGGPVYISDACGHTDAALIGRMIRADGRILGCCGTPKPFLDCLTNNPLASGKALKICNTDGENLYAACFTWDGDTDGIKVTVRHEDIPGPKAAAYLVYNTETGETARLASGTDYSFTMESRSACVLELVPDPDFAVIGMLERLLPGAGVRVAGKSAGRAAVRILCSGTFAFCTEKPVSSVRIDGKEIPVVRKGSLFTVTVEQENAEAEIYL